MKKLSGKYLILFAFFLFSISFGITESGATALYDISIDFNIDLTRIDYIFGDAAPNSFDTLDDFNQFAQDQFNIDNALGFAGGFLIFDQDLYFNSPNTASTGFLEGGHSALGGDGRVYSNGEAVNGFVGSYTYLDGYWEYTLNQGLAGMVTLNFDYSYNIDMLTQISRIDEFAFGGAAFYLDNLTGLSEQDFNATITVIEDIFSVVDAPDPNWSASGQGAFGLQLDTAKPFGQIYMEADTYGDAISLPTPEPSTFLLLGLGGLVFAWRSGLKKRGKNLCK